MPTGEPAGVASSGDPLALLALPLGVPVAVVAPLAIDAAGVGPARLGVRAPRMVFAARSNHPVMRNCPGGVEGRRLRAQPPPN